MDVTKILASLSKGWAAFVVVIAVAGIGGGAYAAWTASLHVEGTIQTGAVDIAWDMQDEREFVGVLDPATGQIVNSPIPPGSGSAICISSLQPGTTDRTVSFQVLDAYPTYTCEITLGALVTGSVPVHVTNIEQELLDAAGNPALATEVGMNIDLTRKFEVSPGVFNCDLDQPVGISTQLHQGDRICAIINVHVTEDAPQDHSYTGSLRIDLIQWNFSGDTLPDNTAPTIVSNGGGATAAVAVAENTLLVTDVQSADDADSEGSGLAYSQTGGADQPLFSIAPGTGILQFLSAPDFENPLDANGDNDYEVQVTVTDADGLTDVQDITVTVTDVNENISMSIALQDQLVGVGRTNNGTITVGSPAPVGGLAISLSLDTAIATVNPTVVAILEGSTEGLFQVMGVSVGVTTLTGTGAGVAPANAQVEVTDSLISIDNIPVVAPGESADLPVSITTQAPPGGLTIQLTSLDPSIAISDATTFVPEGALIPAVNPQITGVALGLTSIRATATGFAPASRGATVALEVTLTPTTLDIPVTRTRQVSAQLSAPAPAGGLLLDLSLDDPTLASHLSTVIIPAGQTLSGPIDLTAGSVLGSTILRAGGSGIVEDTTAIDIVPLPQAFMIQVGGHIQHFFVGVDLQTVARVRLESAPPGPVDIVVSVPANSGVVISELPTTSGSAALLVGSEVTGLFSDSFYIQGLVEGNDVNDDVPFTIEVFEAGTTTPAEYVSLPSDVDIGPSGFDFSTPVDLVTTAFSPDSNVTVRSALLNDGETAAPPNNIRQFQGVRGGHPGVSIDLTNSQPSVGTFTTPVVIPANATSTTAVFDPLAAGTTELGVTQPAGFFAPANGNPARTAIVDAPEAFMIQGGGYVPHYFVGLDLQTLARVRLETAPPVPVDVVVSVPANSGVLLTDAPAAGGSTSLTVATNSTGLFSTTFYIQGLVQGDDIDDDVPFTIEVFETGTTTPAGYVSLPSDVDVGPSGIDFNTSVDIVTTVFAADTGLFVRTSLLNDTETTSPPNNIRQFQGVRGGHPGISIDLTNSLPGVGTLTTPVVIVANASNVSAQFDPLTAGTTELGVTQPTGFTAPVNGNSSRTAIVDAPEAFMIQGGGYVPHYFVGLNLQTLARVRLESAPPSPVDVVVSVPANSGVLLSDSPTTPGSTSLTVATNTTSLFSITFYMQGLVQGDDIDDDVPFTIEVFETGTTTPAGYVSLPSDVDVGPSGIDFNTSTDLVTTTFSPDSTVFIRTSLLNDSETASPPNNIRQFQGVRGGIAGLSVELTNSLPAVGTLSTPVFFAANATSAGAIFDPLTAGTTVFGITLPAGFIAPANGNLARNAVVDAPNLSLTIGSSPNSDLDIGHDLQVLRSIRLQVAAPAPGVDVTVEIVDPTVAVISTDPTAVGTGSITFPLVTGVFAPNIYIQGLLINQGTELKITAPGYDQWITTIQIIDSGFYIASPTSITTTTGAANSLVNIRAASLNANQTVKALQDLRGGLNVDVAVNSSVPAVGTIVTSPLTFSGGDGFLTTQFDPVAVGITTISIVQPAGFTPVAGRTSITATVN